MKEDLKKYKIEENHSSLISRREFFKKTAKVLPVLSVVACCGTTFAHSLSSGNCNNSCYQSCIEACTGTCVGMCAVGCTGICSRCCGNGCQSCCYGFCANACDGSCEGLCYKTCSYTSEPAITNDTIIITNDSIK